MRAYYHRGLHPWPGVRQLGSCRTSGAAFHRRSCTPVHIAPVRLAPENLRFDGLRNLMRCVPQDLEYSSTRRPCAPCASEPAFRGCGTSSAAFPGGSRTSSTHRLPAPCGREPAFWWDAEPDALRSAMPRVLQYTSASRALRIRTRFLRSCGTSSAAFRGARRKGRSVSGGQNTPVGQRPAPRTSALRALRIRTRFWWGCRTLRAALCAGPGCGVRG